MINRDEIELKSGKATEAGKISKLNNQILKHPIKLKDLHIWSVSLVFIIFLLRFTNDCIVLYTLLRTIINVAFQSKCESKNKIGKNN